MEYFLRVRRDSPGGYLDDDHPLEATDADAAHREALALAGSLTTPQDAIVCLMYKRDDGLIGQLQRFR